MSDLALLRREPRTLGFGLLHTVAATVGQTFVVSLFLPGIKASFGLSDAYLSLLFTLTTLASAAALWKVGPWIDRTDVSRYSLACGTLLAVAAATMAAAPVPAVLVAGLFALRLAGNGLLTHVAVTATARHHSRDRGQALSLVLLGSSVGEAAFPAVLVTLIGLWGWQGTLAVAGALALLLVVVANALVRRDAAFRWPKPRVVDIAGANTRTGIAAARADDRPYFAWTAPLFVAMPMTITATVFHQALLARAQGVSLQWFAVSFVAFALVRVPVSIATGRAVDRFGSSWPFCLHLLPLVVGLAVLDACRGPWVAPFYWLCAGIASGMGSVLQATVVAERVAPARLGRARSLAWAAAIVASAVGPSLFGAALAMEAEVRSILRTTVAFLALATVLGAAITRAEARAPARPRPRRIGGDAARLSRVGCRLPRDGGRRARVLLGRRRR